MTTSTKATADHSSTGWPGLAALVLLLGLAMAVMIPLTFTEAPQDDSYISYRYAQNFVNGDGLVFNAGETPVEGYTNFLWTVLIGLGMAAGSDPELLGPALGLLATLGAAWLTALLARRLGARPLLAALAVLLFAVQPSFTVHAISGLETSTFMFLAALSILPRVRSERRTRDDLISTAALSAAALTRPEGIFLFGLLEIADAVAAWSGRRTEPSAMSRWFAGALRRGLPFAVVVGTHMLWRHSFYGDWVPNTFHAKVDPGPLVWAGGLEYAANGARQFGLFLFVLPYLLLRSGPGRAGRLVCAFISTAYLAYIVSVGGDYMPTFRFLLPLIPLWCALAAASTSVLGERLGGQQGRRLATLVFVIMGALGTWVGYDDGEFWPEQDVQQARLVAAGKKLNEILPADAWMAATACGRVPYFAERRCIDMMGLSDAHIGRKPSAEMDTLFLEGHLKGDGRYVLDRQPDVIVFLRLVTTPGSLADSPDWPRQTQRQTFSISEGEIVQDPRFRQEYALYSVPLPDVGVFMNVFAKPGTFDAQPPKGLRKADWPKRN